MPLITDFNYSNAPAYVADKTIVKQKFRKAVESDQEQVPPMLEYLKDSSLEDKLKYVNSYVNSYMFKREDKDEWQQPKQFYDSGGDCEDYALAKYSLLKKLGADVNKLELLVAKDTEKNKEPHMVLVAEGDKSGKMILDNRYPWLRKIEEVNNLIPIYSINDGKLKVYK